MQRDSTYLSSTYSSTYEEESAARMDARCDSASTKKNLFRFAAVGCTILLAVSGTFLLMKSTRPSQVVSIQQSSVFEEATQEETSAPSILSFTLRRVGYPALEYFSSSSSLSGKAVAEYAFLKAHVAVVEPSAPMELSLFHGEKESAYQRTYKFKVCPLSGDESDCQEGWRTYNAVVNSVASVAVTFDCKPFQEFSVEVQEMADDAETVQSVTAGTVEIRALSPADTEAFLSSALSLWAISDEDGKARFGSDYHSVSFLLKYHHFNAGQQKTDHIHNGNGVVLQHIKFTNFFEASMQLVNPSVALPYWEFTADNAKGYKYNNEMMTAAYFGKMTVPAEVSNGFTYAQDDIEDGAIQDGRWAQLRTTFDHEMPNKKYGYGYMRAPWNLNPSPFVSRFAFDFNSTKDALPTCLSHYNSLRSEDMMEFFFQSEMEPHGGNHMETGGVYGCDKFVPLVKNGFIADAASAKQICLFWVPAVMKTLFRMNYLVPQSDCKVNEANLAASECKYICNEDTKTELYQYIHRYTTIHLGLQDMTKSGKITLAEDQTAWLDFTCEGDGSKIFVGDQFESSSPKDPAFWVMHPTLERLLQAKLMNGGFFNEKWAEDAVTERVCDFSRCYDPEEGDTDYYPDCCYGHYANDRMMDISGSGTFGPTNADVLLATDPRTEEYSMPYIYDSFSWPHCKEDFDSLLYQLSVSHTTSSSQKSLRTKPNT